MRRIAAIVLTLGVLGAFGAGCEKKGPFEEAGEEIDEAVQDAEREVEDATD